MSKTTSRVNVVLEDEYAAKLLELAAAKREAGRDVVEIEETAPEDEEQSAEIIDIMAVLKERMGSGGRKPARAQPARAAARASPTRAPGPDALADKSKKELYEQAKQLNLPGRSAMSREELIAALRKTG